MRGHPLGSLEDAVGVICSIEEREFACLLIKDSREVVRPVDAPKLLASQPSSPFNDRRLAGPRNLISDVYIAGGGRQWFLLVGAQR